VVERTALKIEEVVDERSEFARNTLTLLRETFPRADRHSIEELEMEIAEKRLQLLTPYDFHLLGVRAGTREVVAMGAGIYLAGVNAGLVLYLAVRPSWQAHRLGTRLRADLVTRFRENALAAGWDDLSWVLGEVRRLNPWIDKLVQRGGIIPFDLDYYHPGMVPGEADEKYVLYREPIADQRRELPVDEVRQIIYAIFRRAYRVRYPMEKPGFRAMMSELDAKSVVGVDRDFAGE